jgi:PAS domain S-box-containing protein
MTRWFEACVGLLLLGLTTVCASAAGPKRVLILFPFGHDVAPFSDVASAFCNTVEQKFGEPVDFYPLPLDLARYDSPEKEGSLADFLETRLKEKPVDLVVVIGGPSMQFAAQHRERLFPETPILLVAVDPRFIPPDFLRTNATSVTFRANPSAMVEDILQMQPQTTNIVMVFGASALENFWADECRREFQSFTNRVGFTWLNGLSLAQVLERCATLPPHSFILQVVFVVDGAGVPSDNDDALRRLHKVANAPLYGYFASDFGRGIIGGRLDPDSELGVQGARTAIRILRGERPESIPPQLLEATAPVYDWRELQRWGISEARLPAGSVIQFRQPGFWELYRWPVAGTVLFCLLQAALIIGLLVNRTKRRQGEAEATLLAEISSKFVNLPPSEVDREIMDAQRRICEFLHLEVSSLWQWSPEAPGSLTLTHLYRAREGPPTPERMEASEYFPWCQQQLLAGRSITVSSLEELPEEAARDRETWRQFGIKTSLTIPLAVGGGPPIGAVSFNTVRTERDWPDVLVKRLQLVAQIFTNALARKRASQALRESEERMTLAAEATGVGVWMWNISSNEVWASERWHGLFGFDSGGDVSFEKIIQRIHPDDRETVEQEVQRALVNGSDYRGEFRAVLPDGTQRWIVSRGRGYPDASGKPARMLGTAIDITYRKRTELALKESEQRFRQVAEIAGEFIWEVDAKGLYTYASPSVEKIMGYAPEELVGKKHFYDLFDPSVREELKAAAFQVFAERQAFHDFPNPNVSKSGKIVHLETSGAPVLDPAGNLTGYRGADTDVTGRKRVEEALQESEARFRTVANTAPVLIWMSGTDKRCNFFNKSWLDFTGRALEQELGNGWAEGVHPDDLAGCWKIYVESFDARRPFTMEYRLRRHDGEYRWISDHGVPRYDSERDFLGYIGSCVDLTERKRAEEEVCQSEERLRLVLEANSEGVWDWNIPSGKAFFSRRYSAMLGYEPEEFATDYDAWKALVHPDDFERVHAEHVAHIDHGKEFCVEFRMRKKSGDWCWIRARGTVVERDTEGRAIRMVGTHQDISERKQVEAELLRERAELAHVARVSTMGELAASVAHELNQPLGAILANAEAAELFLQQDPPALDDLRAILADIRKDDQRAGEVIRRMRALLRKHELERQPIEINSLVEDVLQFVSGDAALRGISLTADLGPVLPKVSGDRVHLQQALLNLILNGMDAMAGQPRERRRISVRTRLGADSRVELAVIDSGHGIGPDKLPRLFEPFYTTKPNGMGMGLSIARTIIEAHHGRIWAENNASGGAVFRIALPTLEERVVSEQSSAISNR